jgi:hypothetical protein
MLHTVCCALLRLTICVLYTAVLCLPAGAGSGLGGASGAAGGDQLSAMARLLEAGLGRLAELSAEAAGNLLPKVVHLLVPLVSSRTACSMKAVWYAVSCVRCFHCGFEKVNECLVSAAVGWRLLRSDADSGPRCVGWLSC